MEVKGTAVASLPIYVEAKFGKEGLQRWLDSLSESAQKLYSTSILASKWYPLKETFVEPTKKICDVFFNGDLRGARECGRYSAELGLKGVLKIFVKMGSPAFLVSRASTVLPSYYNPCKMETVSSDKTSALIRITEFPQIDKVVEARIIGWIEMALEIHGCKGVRVVTTASLTKGDKYSEFKVSWLG